MWIKERWALTPDPRGITYGRCYKSAYGSTYGSGYGGTFWEDMTYFPMVEEGDLKRVQKEFHGETEELRWEFHEMMLELRRLIVITIQHKLRSWVPDGGGCPYRGQQQQAPPAQVLPAQVPPGQILPGQ
ncbi:UNVERIFIED_CONTAM: hypothetical protein K2H54_010130, partial [Gekko kuhli]